MKAKSTQKLLRESIAPQIADFGNEVLYGMCRLHPLHNDGQIIMGKIWLIGRAYAAAIERRRKNLEINDDFYENTVVPILRRSQIDQRIDSIRRFDYIDNNNAQEILAVHQYLLDLMREMTGLNKRSLASKYLHFHCPNLFFIYDSRAVTALRQLSTERVDLISKISNNKTDREYTKFVYKSIAVKKKIENDFGMRLSVRQFDNLLVRIGNQLLKN